MKVSKNLLFLIVSTLVILTIMLISIWLYSSKMYYPALPFEGGSKKEVVEKLEKSTNELVELANVDGFSWLGFRGNQQAGRDNLIKEMEDRGLKYDSYEGAGIFFENGERIIITGKMWTGDYVLYKIPAGSYLSKRDY